MQNLGCYPAKPVPNFKWYLPGTFAHWCYVLLWPCHIQSDSAKDKEQEIMSDEYAWSHTHKHISHIYKQEDVILNKIEYQI